MQKSQNLDFFSDWIGNNTNDLRCSDWPKCHHPLVVVDCSLHFCLLINEQWIFVIKFLPAQFSWIYVNVEECLNRNFIQSFECNLIRAASYRGDKQVHLFMIGILTWFDGNSSFRNLRIILRDLRFHDTFQFVQPNFFSMLSAQNEVNELLPVKFFIICSC